MYFFYPASGAIERYSATVCTSGATAPNNSQYLMWYDTTNNLIKKSSDYGSTWIAGVSLPIGVFTETTSGITSINQVFNGVGYFGSTVFALPGVKGLAPNGRNEDGTLKNIEILLDKVITRTMTGVSKYSEFAITKSAIGINDHVLKESENYLYNAQGSIVSDRFVGGNVTFSTVSPYNVTSFQPKTTFHAVDYFDAVKSSDFATEIATTTSTASFKNPAVVVENYRSGNNWYRVWSDGWIEQGGFASKGSSTQVTLLKPLNNSNYFVSTTPHSTVEGSYEMVVSARSTTSFTITSRGGAAYLDKLWMVVGQGA